MSNYNGYLLKFGNNIMPNKYITAFSSTPNQRLETSAERDQNGTLQRATLPNYKTKITFFILTKRLIFSRLSTSQWRISYRESAG